MIFPPVFNVTAHLNGVNAFEIVGRPNTQLGFSVAFTGDINGDGRPDIIVGAPTISFNSSEAPVAYVMFGISGSSTFPARFNISSLNGTNGFQVVGLAGSRLGTSVAGAGDVNSDGFQDFIIGAPETNAATGAAYVIFGNATFPAKLSVSSLDGSNGFQITGLSDPPSRTGQSVASVGDVNGDGRPDVVVGTLDNMLFVIFGNNTFPATLPVSALNGLNGFAMTGPWDTAFGYAVSGAGDVNGDGRQDIVTGGWLSPLAWVIFGAASFPAIWPSSALNGTNGFHIAGPANSEFGRSVCSLGDINGDGKADIAVGTYGDPIPLSSAFVILGAANFPAILDTAWLNGRNGFQVSGPDGSALGSAVANIGDINNDGLPDFIVGADVSNQAFVMFGRVNFSYALDTDWLNGLNGFQITGPARSIFASSISGGSDVNGDGRPDFMIGAYGINRAFVILDPTGLTPAQVPAVMPEVVPALPPSQVPAVSPAQVPDLSSIQLPLLPPPPEMPPVTQPHLAYNEGLAIGLGVGLSGAAVIAAVVVGAVIYAGVKGVCCFARSHAGSIALPEPALSGVGADGEI